MDHRSLTRGRLASLLVLTALLIAAGWGLVRIGNPPGAAGTPFRAITAETVPADRPLLLAWEGAGPPYRVTLTTPDGRPVWSSPPLPQGLVRVPPDVQRRLLPGTAYRWSVEGIDRRNRRVISPAYPLRLVPGEPVPARAPADLSAVRGLC